MKYSKHFIEAVKNTWGDTGASWLEKLPDLVVFFQEKWKLKDLRLSPHLSHNLILFAIQGGVPVVLKLSLPGKDFEQEVRVLKIFGGQGVVKLLDFDLKNGGMLQEAVLPGTHLKKLFPDEEEQTISIAVGLMRQIHAVKLDAEASNLPKIESWLASLHANYPDIPNELMMRARSLASDLIKSQGAPVLLHGDLHHDNILKNKDDWMAIDPKGVIGEPAYEVGAFIRNPLPELFENKHIKEIISKRFDCFSALLGVDRQRLINWSFVQAVLAACWACEDNMPERKQMVQCAEVIQRLKRDGRS